MATSQINQLYRQLALAEAGEVVSPEVAEGIAQIATEIVPLGSGFSVLRARYQKPLFVLMGVVALVLLVACINIGTLLLARAQRSRRDVALCMALGSSRRRVLLGLMLESTSGSCRRRSGPGGGQNGRWVFLWGWLAPGTR